MRTRCSAAVLKLTESERIELEHQADADEKRADSARHAKLILLLADGCSWNEIRTRLHCSDSYIARWSKRFQAERLAGLYSKYAGREPYKVTHRLESRVLTRTTRHLPADGSGRWSSRKLAAELGGTISHTTVARIWARHGITPKRLESRPVPDQLPFDAGAADIVGLYLSPPQHAAIFSVSGIHADTADTRDVRSPRIRRHQGADDHGGAQALYATLKRRRANTTTSAPMNRQTSAEFAAFLAAVAAGQPDDTEIHVIADNPAAGKTRAITAMMADHPTVHMHFTATHDAWLDQVERSLAEMEGELNVQDERQPTLGLRQKLMRQIRRRNRRPHPTKWSYLKAIQAQSSDDRSRSRGRYG